VEIIWKPKEIENKSMQIIDGFISGYHFSEIERDVVKRVIHTTGDPNIVNNIHFHPEAAETGIKALTGGANIFTDVNMLKAGVNSRKLEQYGGNIFCTIAESETAESAQNWGITRAAAAMRLHGEKLSDSIVAIGNAPTALFEVLDLIEKGIARPALIVGTPVGFVGAVESKELLMQKNIVPYITIRGTRGGSPIAASIINALMYFKGD
jgi:precorrin-8X/cobalt-precorrin-8 methylmutase